MESDREDDENEGQADSIPHAEGEQSDGTRSNSGAEPEQNRKDFLSCLNELR